MATFLCCSSMPFLNMFKFIGNYRIALLLLKTIYQSVLLLNLVQFLTLILGVGRGVGWWSLLVQKSKVQGQFQMRLNSNAQLSVRQEDIFHHLSVSPSALFSFYIKSEMATGTSRLRVHSLGSPGRRENSLSWLVILVPLPLLPSLCG